MRLIKGSVLTALSLAVLFTLTSTLALAQHVKPETIEGTVMGTGTQFGQMVGFTLTIYEYSTPEDRQVLVEAFMKGQNQGLVNALQKMRAVGHVAITGTLGYDCSYIRMIPTETGRTIRFITNRPLRFGEVWADSTSQAFNLTGGEIVLNDQQKNKGTGQIFPAAQLILNKEGELQIDLNQNAWKIVNIIDWKGTQGVN